MEVKEEMLSAEVDSVLAVVVVVDIMVEAGAEALHTSLVVRIGRAVAVAEAVILMRQL